MSPNSLKLSEFSCYVNVQMPLGYFHSLHVMLTPASYMLQLLGLKQGYACSICVCMCGGKGLGGFYVLQHQVDQCVSASVGGNQIVSEAWQRHSLSLCSSFELAQLVGGGSSLFCMCSGRGLGGFYVLHNHFFCVFLMCFQHLIWSMAEALILYVFVQFI